MWLKLQIFFVWPHSIYLYDKWGLVAFMIYDEDILLLPKSIIAFSWVAYTFEEMWDIRRSQTFKYVFGVFNPKKNWGTVKVHNFPTIIRFLTELKTKTCKTPFKSLPEIISQGTSESFKLLYKNPYWQLTDAPSHLENTFRSDIFPQPATLIDTCMDVHGPHKETWRTVNII